MNLIYIAKAKDKNKKVKEFLRGKDVSSILMQRLKQEMGLISCNGRPVTANFKIQNNDKIEIIITEKPNLKIELDPTPIDILYEDEHLLVVNKPSLVSTIPNGNRPHLAGRVLNYLKERYNFSGTFMPINRLDIETSGIVLIAKSCYIQYKMQADFKKTYLAVANGKLNKFGTINEPIGVDENNRNKRKVDENGKESITKYTRIGYSKKLNISLVKIKLLTGRTHQIRVHFSFSGHSLLSDGLYGTSSNLITRTALHAYKLSFIQPITKKRIKIVCKPPEDFANVVKHCF